MKKTLVTFIITILMLATFVTTVQALSFGVTLTPSITEVEKEGTVKVVVAVNNIDAENGLNALLGNLEYDKNIFETVSNSDIKALNEWDSVTYNADKGKLVTTKAQFVNNNSDVFEINLKVKSTASTGSTTITLNNISASNSKQDITAQNASCTVTVKEKTTAKPDEGGSTTLKPTAEVKYETVNNGIKVTITSNSTLKTLSGWTLSSDKKQLSKVYTADYTGTITITDENGNVSDPINISAKVGSSNDGNNNNGNNNGNNGGSSTKDTTKPTASVKYTKDAKGVVTVTITASEQIQPLTGWTLSADKKTLTKQYTKNTTETVTIVDLAGNKSEAIKITVDTSLPNGGKDVVPDNNNGGTKSPDALPKAGVAFILPVIAIITVAGTIAFVRYKSMEY